MHHNTAAASHRHGWLPCCRNQLLLRRQERHADQRLLRQATPAVQARAIGSIKPIHICLQPHRRQQRNSSQKAGWRKQGPTAGMADCKQQIFEREDAAYGYC
jgi:hypothetical protein